MKLLGSPKIVGQPFWLMFFSLQAPGMQLACAVGARLKYAGPLALQNMAPAPAGEAYTGVEYLWSCPHTLMLPLNWMPTWATTAPRAKMLNFERVTSAI